jgi:hypothetical protein
MRLVYSHFSSGWISPYWFTALERNAAVVH